MIDLKFLFPVAVCALPLWMGCSSSSGMGSSTNHPVGTGATVTQATGPSGGTVTLEGTTLDIPAGALPAMESISIASTMDAPPAGVSNLSPVYKFGPDGLVFTTPITVHLTFTAGAVGHPIIVWSKLGGVGFETVATTAQGDIATAQVTHFSQGFVADDATVGALPSGGASSDASASSPDSSVGAADGAAAGNPDATVDGALSAGDASTGDDGALPGTDAGTGGGSCSVCSSGYCETSCAAGTVVCGSTSPGQCVDRQTDPNNCGACGNVCPRGQGCLAGQCAASCGLSASSGCAGPSSPDGGVNCSSCNFAGMTFTACGNQCAALASDNHNCGSCGNTCKTGQSCVSGACTPVCAGGAFCANGLCGSSCPAGQTACAGGGANVTAFCTDINGDSANCGACGNACASGHVCRSGACVPTCGLSASSGCAGPSSPDGGINCSSCSFGGMISSACGNQCVQLATDPRNCGTCGNVCGAGQTCNSGTCGSLCPGTDFCVNSACLPSCPTGTMQCTSVGSNATGTCVSVQSDSNNCGTCGHACPQGQACSAGACVAFCGSGASSADAGAGAPIDASPGG